MSEIDKTKNMIDLKINKELEKVYDLTAKVGNVRCNDDDIKVVASAGFGAMAWGASLFLMPLVLNAGAWPIEIIQPLFVAVPAAIGIGGQQLLTKGFKNKERLAKTTNARTQTDRIVAATKLEIEKNKKLAKIDALDEAGKRLGTRNEIAESLPEELRPATIGQDTRTVQEFNHSINAISRIIEEKTPELDKTVIKKTLKERFRRIRDKHQATKDMSVLAILSTLAGIVIYNMPAIMSGIGIGSYNFGSSIFQIILPGLITGAATTAFVIKNKNDQRKAFEILNKELLGEESLSETVDEEDSKKSDKYKVERFETDYQRQVSEIAGLTSLLFAEKTAKRAKYGDKEDILFEDVEPVKITKETREHVLEHPELYSSCPARIRNGQFYTDEEYEQHVEESLNRPLPGEEKGIQFTKRK